MATTRLGTGDHGGWPGIKDGRVRPMVVSQRAGECRVHPRENPLPAPPSAQCMTDRASRDAMSERLLAGDQAELTSDNAGRGIGEHRDSVGGRAQSGDLSAHECG